MKISRKHLDLAADHACRLQTALAIALENGKNERGIEAYKRAMKHWENLGEMLYEAQEEEGAAA